MRVCGEGCLTAQHPHSTAAAGERHVHTPYVRHEADAGGFR